MTEAFVTSVLCLLAIEEEGDLESTKLDMNLGTVEDLKGALKPFYQRDGYQIDAKSIYVFNLYRVVMVSFGRINDVMQWPFEEPAPHKTLNGILFHQLARFVKSAKAEALQKVFQSNRLLKNLLEYCIIIINGD